MQPVLMQWTVRTHLYKDLREHAQSRGITDPVNSESKGPALLGDEVQIVFISRSTIFLAFVCRDSMMRAVATTRNLSSRMARCLHLTRSEWAPTQAPLPG